MASSTVAGEICQVPSPIDGIVVPGRRISLFTFYATSKSKMNLKWAETEQTKYKEQIVVAVQEFGKTKIAIATRQISKQATDKTG